ncbi:hypothetical protein [Chromobacterium violaceum]|nr:hypothetical protein [Chromobacterium violaceum]
MNKILIAFRHWRDWWQQGMAIHARQVCRDEMEALERIRNRMEERP